MKSVGLLSSNLPRVIDRSNLSPHLSITVQKYDVSPLVISNRLGWKPHSTNIAMCIDLSSFIRRSGEV